MYYIIDLVLLYNVFKQKISQYIIYLCIITKIMFNIYSLYTIKYVNYDVLNKYTTNSSTNIYAVTYVQYNNIYDTPYTLHISKYKGIFGINREIRSLREATNTLYMTELDYYNYNKDHPEAFEIPEYRINYRLKLGWLSILFYRKQERLECLNLQILFLQ